MYFCLFLVVYSVPLIDMSVFMLTGFLSGSASEESAFNAGDTGDASSIHGLRTAPGEGNGNPIPVFLPEKSPGQKSLVGYSPKGHKESARLSN